MNTKLFKILTLLSFLICIVIIVILYSALKVADHRLEKLGQIVDEIAVQHIITDVSIDDTIPLNSDIFVTEEIEVNIDLKLKTEIPLNVEIPVDQSILVPFEMGVLDNIRP